MRPPSDMPRRVRRRRRLPTGRGRSVLLVGAVVLFVLLTSLRGIAGFYTDYLWFESLGLSGVWSGVLSAKVALAVIFTGLFFAISWINLYIADRIAPRFRPTGPEEDLIERYHDLVGRRSGLVRAGVALVFAVIAGAGVSAQWNEWLLFTNRVDFGQKDATFDTDIGFYVFQLPFLNFVLGWLFSALVIVLIITLVAHYLNGGIRLQTPSQRVTPQVKAHLSVLLGMLALVKAGQYWLDRYELVFSTRGTVQGATYTDVNVQVQVIYLLVLISLFAFLLFIVNIWRRGWILPLLAVGLWAIVALLAGEAVPAFVQRFRVAPDESAKEQPYIRNNIEATRQALGLADVEQNEFEANGELTGEQLVDNAGTVENIRLWDPEVLEQTYQKLQELRAFYEIRDVDVDRYEIDGETVQTMLSARELSRDGVPQKSWEGQHLAYTHGYGAVLAPANAKDRSGQPILNLSDVPVQARDGSPELDQASIYIGEGQQGYVLVNTEIREILYQNEERETVYESYRGRDGIRIGGGVGGFLRRAAFALRFSDVDPLISGTVQPSSKMLIQRDVRKRVEAVAPFLSFDADPYPVVVDGKLQWVLDGYTTTNRYPNAQRADTADLPEGSGLRRNFNYVRNSVKAVVDAYDGTVNLYIVDERDPLIRAYRKAFPELFDDADAVPEGLRDHFRYPEDLFRVQTSMWGRYHVEDPSDFYNGNDAWNVAQDPTAPAANPETTTASSTTAPSGVVESGRSGRISPYYQLTRLPGEEDESFLILRPFVPASAGDRNEQLTAFMVAKSDPGEYGNLEIFSMPSSRLPNGPQIAAAAMQSDEEVSRQTTLLCQRGARCLYGNIVLIPIEQSLLYVRPVYAVAQSTEVPQLRKVIVAFQSAEDADEVAIGDTLQEALEEIFGQSPGTREERPAQPPDEQPDEQPEEEPDGQPQPEDPTEAELVDQLLTALDEAEGLRQDGDFAGYAAKLEEVEEIASQLEEVRGTEGGTDGGADGPTTTTTPPSTTAPPN